MPDFVAEAPAEELAASDSDALTLTELLSLPYAALSDHFRKAAFDLKETVLRIWICGFSRVLFLRLTFSVSGREGNVDVERKPSAGLDSVHWGIGDGFPGFEILPSFQQ